MVNIKESEIVSYIKNYHQLLIELQQATEFGANTVNDLFAALNDFDIRTKELCERMADLKSQPVEQYERECFSCCSISQSTNLKANHN